MGREIRRARASFRVAGAGAVFLTLAPWLSSPSSALMSGAAAGGPGWSGLRTATATTVVGAPVGGALASADPATAPSLVAASAAPVTVYQAPEGTGVGRVLDPANEVSGQLVFLVRRDVPGWLEVDLPVRPNGSTGWVRRDQVELSQHRYRIELSVSQRRLQVYRGAELLLDEPIGVGARDTPTPGGRYYLKELLRPPDPDGFYGPYAYGLSGFSNEVFDYRGGEGVIGIHGTDDPDSVGRDVSSGCIRLRNQAIVRLAEEIGLPLGTPVEISV